MQKVEGKKHFNDYDGKTHTVCLFSVEQKDEALWVKMVSRTDKGRTFSAVFRNVSDLIIDKVSLPFVIYGLEISQRKEPCADLRRYYVEDYDDYDGGVLSFYCGDFEISEIDNEGVSL